MSNPYRTPSPSGPLTEVRRDVDDLKEMMELCGDGTRSPKQNGLYWPIEDGWFPKLVDVIDRLERRIEGLERRKP